MQRIGPRMRAIADYVSAVPGCSKAQALRGVGLPVCGLGYMRPMDRAIWAGLVLCEKVSPTVCRLFADETARDLYYFRRELLHGEPTADRSGQLLVEVAVLRARQASEYAKAASR